MLLGLEKIPDVQSVELHDQGDKLQTTPGSGFPPMWVVESLRKERIKDKGQMSREKGEADSCNGCFR